MSSVLHSEAHHGVDFHLQRIGGAGLLDGSPNDKHSKNDEGGQGCVALSFHSALAVVRSSLGFEQGGEVADVADRAQQREAGENRERIGKHAGVLRQRALLESLHERDLLLGQAG